MKTRPSFYDIRYANTIYWTHAPIRRKFLRQRIQIEKEIEKILGPFQSLHNVIRRNNASPEILEK